MSKKVWFAVGIICLLIGITYTVVTAQAQSEPIGVDLLPEALIASAPIDEAQVRSLLTEDMQRKLAEMDPSSYVRVTFNLHGTCLLEIDEDTWKDASALFFQVGGEWRWANLAFMPDLGFVNCSHEDQTMEIPFARFRSQDGKRQLDPALAFETSAIGFRAFGFGSVNVEIKKAVAMEYQLPTC